MNRARKAVCEKRIALNEVKEEKKRAAKSVKWALEFIKKNKRRGGK